LPDYLAMTTEKIKNTPQGKLYLIPTPLVEPFEDNLHTIPAYVIDIIHGLDTFIAERAKTARHFIKATKQPIPQANLTVFELDDKGQFDDYQVLSDILNMGKSVGVLSEAGCPGVADPGATVVAWAHRQNIEVVPLVGPSSILLALMASGMNGQSFTFHGYVSAKREDLGKDLKKLEETAKRLQQTQIFIETPYRNGQMIETAFKVLQPNTRFGIAADLTGSPQYIAVKTIAEWKKTKLPELHKHPVVFLIL
jgi:16S rRNA (cytidine1402-2'-O)-methyltransferase